MNAITELQAERQKLVGRLAEIDKILRQFDELERAAETYLATSRPYTSPTDSDSNQHPEPVHGGAGPITPDRFAPPVSRPKTAMAEFVDKVEAVLTSTDRPLERTALYKALLERDVVIGSPDENADLNTLSARMSRLRDKFINIPGHGYWLKRRAYPKGDYSPSKTDLSDLLSDESGNPRT